jgi:serine/threonine-protein kinase
MHAIANDELPDPRAFRDNIPEEVVAIMMRALERDRDKRYRTAGEMGAALQLALTKLAPGVGASDVASFMIALFGQEAMDDRSHVPNLVDSTPTALLRNRPAAPVIESTLDEHTPTDNDGGPTTLEMPMFQVPAPPRQRLPWVVGALGIAGLVAAGALFVTSTRNRSLVLPPPMVQARPVIVPAPPPVTETSLPPPVVPAKTIPSAPHPRKLAAVEKPGSLDQKSIETVVKAAHPRLTECLRRYSADLPAASGQIVIEVTVVATGKVSAARALMPEVRSAGLGACLTTEATKLRFPRNPDKQTTFRFPVMFQRKGP